MFLRPLLNLLSNTPPKRKPVRWFTSDCHFGHRNVIDYCQRPFANVDEMHIALIKQWNSQVMPGDTVYVLGDFSLSPKWSGILGPVLNGDKILVLGNHDAPFPRHCNREQKANKIKKMYDRYLSEGWKELHLHKEIVLKNGRHVLLSHLPYANKWALEHDKRYLEYRPIDKGMFLLHGHLHGRYKKCYNMVDVGMDAHGLKLLSEDEVIELINSKEEVIPSALTEFYKTRQPNEEM